MAADRAPNADGRQVRYASVYPNIDLRYTLLTNGVKEDIILTAPTPVSSFAFVLDAPGLSAAMQEDGSVHLATAEETVFEIPAPFMVDSAPEDDGDGVRSTDVRYELLTVAGQSVLAVIADPTWLADPARVYPVYIDPTTTTTYSASSDTFISSAYPSYSLDDQWNATEGGYYELWNGYYDSTSGTNYAFVKTGHPAGKSVTSATFSAYVQHAYSAGTATSIYAGRLTSGFTESQTWDMTDPSYVALTSTTVTDNDWADFNVTSAVQGWSEGATTNHGFRIYQSSTSQSLWKRLRARENSTNSPKLVVTYTNPAATASNPTGGEWTKSSTLSWTYSGNGSSFSQTKYQAQISTSSTDFSSTYLEADSGVVSSSSTSWAAPATNLVNGTTYYWRVKVFDGHSWSAWSSAASFKRDAADPALTSVAVSGAVTVSGDDHYETGTGSFTVKVRGSDAHSGIDQTYAAFYHDAYDDLAVSHDWSVGGTNCTDLNPSSQVDVTGCSESYNSGGVREVTFTVAGTGVDAAFDLRYGFLDTAGNRLPDSSYTDSLENLIFDATAPAGSISAPSAGATVNGTVTISGTASDANFTQYEVHYGAGASPTSWTSIGSNPRTTQVTNGTLASWNATGLASGTYTVRLIVKDRARVNSGFTTVTRTVTVDNDAPTAVIGSPSGERLVDGLVEISGTASAAAQFADYTLHYGSGCAPTTWIDIGVNPRTSQVSDGLLGVWDTAGLAGDHTVRLVVRRSNGPTSTDTVCVTIGSSLGLQPQHTSERWVLGAGDELAVNVATGNAIVTHPLVVLPYRGDSLPIALTYNSLSTQNVGLGVGWQLNLQRRLIENANGSMTFIDADGARHLFSGSVTSGSISTYTRPASLYATLVRDTNLVDDYTVTYRDGSVDRFDDAGSTARLTRHADRHGNAIDLTYGAGNQIAQVTDPAGRSVDFTWSPGGELTSIRDWAYIDASGVLQAGATGARREYRFFHAAGQLAGWSEPLNTSGSCPGGGSHLTCLTYTGGLLSGVSKTQTVTTFASGALGTAARAITTQLTYADGRVATVTDAEQAARATPARTTFSWADADSLTVARPTTSTAYELLVADDPYARVRSALRRLDSTTSIERRTSWDSAFPIEPESITDNAGAVQNAPARTTSYTYVASSLGLLQKMVEPLTATTNRWTELTYNANHDITQTNVSQDGSGSLRTVTRSCYSADCATSGAGLSMLKQIDNYVSGGAVDDDTNVATEFTSDTYGQRTRVIRHNRDAAGATLDDREDRFSFDAVGNLSAEVVNYVNGTVTNPGDDITPNASGARTDLTTSHTYDTAGNRVSTADPRRAIEAAKGTSLGADDFVARSAFDALNQLLTQKTATTPGLTSTQRTSSSTYDEFSATRTTTDFGGLVTATEFDRGGRALRDFEDPDPGAASITTIATYDADGKPLTVKDRKQAADATLGTTTYGYDALGRRASLTDADGAAGESLTTMGYDGLDRQTSLEVGTGSTSSLLTTYSHDLGGRVTVTDDGFTCATEAFDYRDLATSTTSGLAGGSCVSAADTRTLTHTLDGLGRPTRSEVTAGADLGDRTVDEVYDGLGNRRSAAVRTGGVTSTTTFSLNRLDQGTYEARADGSTAKATFDPAGNELDRCYWKPGITAGACLPVGTTPWSDPPTQVTSAAYDARNERISLTDAAAGSTTTYDPDHNYALKALYRTTASGREHQSLHAYDVRHRLTDMTFQTCTATSAHACTDTPVTTGSDTYVYDDNDNRSQVAENNGAASSDRRYCYDARNQLTFRNSGAACSSSANDEAWTYDAAGNRLTSTSGGITTNFAYDATGRLCDAEVGAAVSCTDGNISHDTAGRIESWNSWILAYDAEARLTSACKSATCASGSDKVEFTYDGQGHRTKIVATAASGTVTTTEFRYQNGAVVEERVNGTVVRQFVTDEASSISKLVVPAGQTDAGTYLVTWNGHGDALNLLRVNADGTTTLANSFTYDSWGKATTATHSSIGDLGFRYLYVGQFDVQWDDTFGLGLHYMHARHYSPVLGRFLQPDPHELETNHHEYSTNSPVSTVDPDGTYAWRIGYTKFYHQAMWPHPWGVTVAAEYRYNGVKVEKRWVSCGHWGYGYDVEMKWCGAWNSGGARMDIGADFKVSALWRTSPIAVTKWVRRFVDKNGTKFGVRGG